MIEAMAARTQAARPSRGRARLAALALAALLAAARGAPAAPEPVAARIEALVAAAELPGLRWPRFPDHREALVALYAPRGYAPLWLEDGRPTEQAAEAVRVLLGADALGLAATDYDAFQLEATRRSLAEREGGTPDARARFDVALSVGLLRHVADVHGGRVNPNLSFGFDLDPKPLDLAPLVAAAVRMGRVAELIPAVSPPFVQHALLVEQLARYRTLAADAAVGPVTVTGTIRPGTPAVGLAGLRRWLVALGDLPPGTAEPPEAGEAPALVVAPAPGPVAGGAHDAGTPVQASLYEGDLVAGVRRFQQRHGLEPDGVIGPATARALAVPAERRVHQIQLALERLRWVPALGGGPAVFVNIPAFELFATDDASGVAPPSLQMRVVVGKAGSRTPVFTGALQTIVFAPYWNVPRSIVVREILPKLRRNPGYLAAQDMEIVGGGVEDLVAGRARLRQRPGPQNALGRVKFLFPNDHSVYLHDTPSRGLFARARRDFSHGCIRIEKPAELAAWLLRDRPDWPPERQRAAMEGRRETAVRIDPPVPVVIFYTTAVARRDGSISFYEDVYGHDAALERVLAAGYPYPSRPERTGSAGAPASSSSGSTTPGASANSTLPPRMRSMTSRATSGASAGQPKLRPTQPPLRARNASPT
jgi:murein L,D-transpeptidase YcbB/YkuD